MDEQTVGKWYEQETGLSAKQGSERIKKIIAFLTRRKLTVSDVEVYSRKVDSKYGYKPLVARESREKIGSTSPTTTKTTEYYIQEKKGK